ncbi:MAG: chorismate-binding protein, partial [Solirubrobacteraceae bacterium]
MRDAAGLVGLVGDWLGPLGPVTLVAHDPSRVVADPAGLVAALDDLPSPAGPPPGARVGSGWLGILGYQLGRLFERVPPPAAEPAGGPGFLGYYESVLCFDERDASWSFEAVVEDGAEQRIEDRFAHDLAALERAAGAAGDPRAYAVGDYVLEPSAIDHAAAVAAVKSYIEAGDVFQVNACLHAIATFEGDALDLCCAGFERLAPRFGAFVRTRSGAICCFSPELFLRATGRSVLTSPIKGTARRPAQPAAADLARAALVASAKDAAENAMIVDLMRNDLGRVCTPGSVRVAELARA